MSVTPPRRKAPRRTAERIREAALGLFNRFGEPNVSTQAIAAELGISDGNLHYHFRTKDSLVNALFEQFAQAHAAWLQQAPIPGAAESLMQWLQGGLELGWVHRFLLRDTNDLVTRNHVLELGLRTAREARIERLRSAVATPCPAADAPRLALALDQELTSWISREYLTDPRHALDEPNGAAAQERALAQLTWLLAGSGLVRRDDSSPCADPAPPVRRKTSPTGGSERQ